MIDYQARARLREDKRWETLTTNLGKLSEDFATYSTSSVEGAKTTQAELTKYMIQRFDFQIALQVEMLKTLKSIERKLKK